VTFSFYGKETYYIARIFKNANLGISRKTKHSLNHTLNFKPATLTNNKCQYSSVCQLTCKECGNIHTGQTGKSLKIRYNEYLRAFKYGTSKSNFTQQVLDYGHSFGRMENIMKAIYLSKKGSHLSTMEKFYIYKETKIDNQLNDKHSVI
jgi:hypothetical protein